MHTHTYTHAPPHHPSHPLLEMLGSYPPLVFSPQQLQIPNFSSSSPPKCPRCLSLPHPPPTKQPFPSSTIHSSEGKIKPPATSRTSASSSAFSPALSSDGRNNPTRQMLLVPFQQEESGGLQPSPVQWTRGRLLRLPGAPLPLRKPPAETPRACSLPPHPSPDTQKPGLRPDVAHGRVRRWRVSAPTPPSPRIRGRGGSTERSQERSDPRLQKSPPSKRGARGQSSIPWAGVDGSRDNQESHLKP